jgi:hypothetical protein
VAGGFLIEGVDVLTPKSDDYELVQLWYLGLVSLTTNIGWPGRLGRWQVCKFVVWLLRCFGWLGRLVGVGGCPSWMVGSVGWTLDD